MKRKQAFLRYYFLVVSVVAGIGAVFFMVDVAETLSNPPIVTEEDYPKEL